MCFSNPKPHGVQPEKEQYKVRIGVFVSSKQVIVREAEIENKTSSTKLLIT